MIVDASWEFGLGLQVHALRGLVAVRSSAGRVALDLMGAEKVVASLPRPAIPAPTGGL